MRRALASGRTKSSACLARAAWAAPAGVGPREYRDKVGAEPGGVGQRPLGIPTIRDRVVETAAALVLEPIFEADFDAAAYGYRPKRSAIDAGRDVSEAI